jgi:hypothetical protein
MRPSTVLLVASMLLLGARAGAQQINTTTVSARAILHTDGTRTESVKDVIKREMKDTTYDARGVVIATKIFLLNDNGEPVQGVIRDGADNLIARVQFFFDDLGRVIEERCVNTQNEIFRRVIHQYDPNGRPLPVKSFDYEVNAPSMRAGKINFTNIVPPPDGNGTAAPAPSGQPQQPGQAPQIQTVSPRGGAPKPADPKARNPFGGKK